MSDKDKLTDKQKKFCEEYVLDWNATRAAKAAGYSENSASEMGYENLRKPQIKSYIEELKKKTAELAGVSPLSQVKELKKIAYGNMADLFDEWISLEDFDNLTAEQKSAIAEISYSKKTIKSDAGSHTDVDFVKVKLHDKMKAIQEINKMLGFHAPEKSEVNMKSDLSLNINLPEPDEATKRRWEESQIKYDE